MGLTFSTRSRSRFLPISHCRTYSARLTISTSPLPLAILCDRVRYYWCSGSNLDSAPDTNQMDVTDPGEPLVNGAMSSGRGVLFSIKRAWVVMPNFFNALATATGTQGSTWSLQATSINRGLFIPRCLAVEGGGNIFFRVDDGIHISPGGLESQSRSRMKACTHCFATKEARRSRSLATGSLFTRPMIRIPRSRRLRL